MNGAVASIDIPLAPVGGRARALAFALVTVPITVLVWLNGGLREPLNGAPGGWLVGLGMLGGLGLIGLMSLNRLRMEAGTLRLRACGLHTHTVPLTHVDWSGLASGSLPGLPEHAGMSRINGVHMPGYRAGWFRRANGERALVAVTDTERVIALSLRDGGALLVSPRDMAAALAALRHAGQAAGR